MFDAMRINTNWIYLLAMACVASFALAIPVYADYYEWQAHTGYVSLSSATTGSYSRVDSLTTSNSELSLGVAHVPAVTTGSAIETDSGATFQGELTSMGGFPSTEVWFEYGQTSGYGSSTAHMTQLAVGDFSQDVTLATGIWHYRAVSHNLEGDYAGSDQTVTLSMDNRPPDLSTNPTVVQLAFLSMMMLLSWKIVSAGGAKPQTIIILVMLTVIGYMVVPIMFIN